MIRLRRISVQMIALSAVIAILVPAPASAHVSIDPGQVTGGGYGRFAFRVPNESDTASTTAVTVNLPDGTPIASVATMPVAGWTVQIDKRTLNPPLRVHDAEITEAVSAITWTADPAAAIKPGQFQEFPVAMGQLPKTGALAFKTLQTYSDGTVVRWIEDSGGVEASGAAEPQHPAPRLILADGPPAPPPTAMAAGSSAGSDAEGSTGLDLGAAGLVAGVLGLLLGAIALARGRAPRRQPLS